MKELDRRSINFFKLDDGEWYADWPGHSLAKNRMVAGADRFLELIHRSDKYPRVHITVTNQKTEHSLYKLRRIQHDSNGASYIIKRLSDSVPSVPIPFAWLCNVTHDVLGEHWKEIYIESFY